MPQVEGRWTPWWGNTIIIAHLVAFMLQVFWREVFQMKQHQELQRPMAAFERRLA